MLLYGTEYLTPTGWSVDPRGDQVMVVRDGKLLFERFPLTESVEPGAQDTAGFPAEGLFFEVLVNGNVAFAADKRQALHVLKPALDEVVATSLDAVLNDLRDFNAYWHRFRAALDFELFEPRYHPYAPPSYADVSSLLVDLVNHRWSVQADGLHVVQELDQEPAEVNRTWVNAERISDQVVRLTFEGGESLDYTTFAESLFVHAMFFAPLPIMEFIQQAGQETGQRWTVSALNMDCLQLAAAATGMSTGRRRRTSIRNGRPRSRRQDKTTPLSLFKGAPEVCVKGHSTVYPMTGSGFATPDNVVTRYKGSIVVL